MSTGYHRRARRRAVVAALAGLLAVTVFGPSLGVPALALVALVYYSHHLAAALAGDVDVPYPSLAFVIVLNATVVLLVQSLLFVASLLNRA